jgi:hypothetical protein
MPPVTDDFDAKAERKFRVGYTHAVTHLIAAVAPLLSEEDVLKLKTWASTDLMEWRMRATDRIEEAPSPPSLRKTHQC